MSELIRCWSCTELTALYEVGEADGDCPLCGVEIDLTEYLGAAIKERDALSAEVGSLREALGQAHMALIGYLPAHRNAITDAAIESARAALAGRKEGV